MAGLLVQEHVNYECVDEMISVLILLPLKPH